MNTNLSNFSTQNQGILNPNYRPSPNTNPIQAPINNFNRIIPQNGSNQPINMNPIPSGDKPVNIRPPQINPIYQQSNIRSSPPNHNANIIQPQNFVQNKSNMIYNQTPKINTNLAYTRQNQIQILNNIIPYNKIRNLNKNMIQRNIYQIQPLNMRNNNIKNQIINKNINQINLGNNLNQNKIINNLIKNSMIQNRKNEAMNGHPPIPVKYTTEAMKSICKISYYYDNKKTFGTGFFMKYSDSLKLLITNYHVIFPALMNNNIQIEIWNSKKMILNLVGRYTKFLDLPKDITSIEIKTTDKIYKDIQFLNYDHNYNPCGYNVYKDKYIFSIEHPLGQDAASASGKIINIYNFQFDHDISTDNGSSGSPIILLNLMMVIGIHKNTDSKSVNGGTFIGEIINEINNDFNSRNQNNNDNFIICEINIKDEDVTKI